MKPEGDLGEEEMSLVNERYMSYTILNMQIFHFCVCIIHNMYYSKTKK